MEKISYPFVPKSTAHLRPGQFWSIPLSNGNFGCGRVVELNYEDGKINRRAFLTGLLDWTGEKPPSSESIAGCRTIEQGLVHVKTVKENGGQILGWRELEEDGIEPDFMLSQSPGRGCMLMRGCEIIRRATQKEQSIYPVFSVWGYGYIKELAESRLV